jgi:hypothetical protein
MIKSLIAIYKYVWTLSYSTFLLDTIHSWLYTFMYQIVASSLS